MENQAGQYTTEYEILDLAKLKLYQQFHGLAPVLGAVRFRIEEQKQPEQVMTEVKIMENWDKGRVETKRAFGPTAASFISPRPVSGQIF